MLKQKHLAESEALTLLFCERYPYRSFRNDIYAYAHYVQHTFIQIQVILKTDSPRSNVFL